MNNKDIENHNTKGQYHGYQEWYVSDGGLWVRGDMKNGFHIGYQEFHQAKLTGFYIR